MRALSSGILLYGFSLIYGFTGSTSFEDIKLILSESNNLSLGLIFGLSITFLIGSSMFETQLTSLMEYFGTYFISYFPYDIRLDTVLIIMVVSLLITILSVIYPARTASKLHPIEILRNE